MTETPLPSFTVVDPKPLAENARYTFLLPGEDEAAAVGIGDLIKLLIEYSHRVEKWSAERMWVEVKEFDGITLRGRLENVPDEPTSPLQKGDLISFRRSDILAISWLDPAHAPEPQERREYWDRCLVDDCVLAGAEPVELIYREKPNKTRNGDGHPDSGWRIRGRIVEASHETFISRRAQYVAIGAVLNRDDSWLHLIDLPVGSAFVRNFETGYYEATH